MNFLNGESAIISQKMSSVNLNITYKMQYTFGLKMGDGLFWTWLRTGT